MYKIRRPDLHFVVFIFVADSMQVLLSNNALANNPQVAHHLEQMMPVSMAAMSSMQQQVSQSMSLTTLAAAASLPSSGLGMEPSVSGLGGTLGVVREVSHLEAADSAEHVVSHSQEDSLLQVVSTHFFCC